MQRIATRLDRAFPRIGRGVIGSPCRLIVIRCWEDRRVESRCRLALIVACSCLAISTAGCSDALNAGPLEYVESEALTKDLGPNKPNLAGKPKLQNAVRNALADLYGPSPQEIRVPQGAPLPNGGIYLGNYLMVGEGADAKKSGSTRVKAGAIRTSSRRMAAMRSIGAIACTVTGSRAPATARRQRSSIPYPATIARGSSSLPRPPPACSRIATTCAGRSLTACTGRRCRPSNPS